jgi:hypothetical protein
MSCYVVILSYVFVSRYVYHILVMLTCQAKVKMCKTGSCNVSEFKLVYISPKFYASQLNSVITTLVITLYILWYQLISHKARVFCLT